MSQKKLQANLKILNQQVADLEEERERVERYPYRSSEEEIETWWIKAGKAIGSVEQLVGADVEERQGKHNCSFGLCVNPKSLSQRSKKAGLNCKAVAKLVQEARGFEDIQRDQYEEADRFEELKSRKDVLQQILAALGCCSINTVGVYGKPGAGKTMLVREVKREAEEKELFDAVIMATVTQNPRIQDKIAHDLGQDHVSKELTYQEAPNPRKVIRRLTEKKVLLILDVDFCEPEIHRKLRETLPLVDKNEDSLLSYKTLLTYGDSWVLSDPSEKQFEVELLKEDEAWMLFEKIATYRTESRSLPFYAKEICKNCFRLPIAVAILAKALKSGKLKWRTALQGLKNDESLHSAFKISYNCLKSSKLQQTFLLCGLMGPSAAIQDLLKYGIGLDLFRVVNSIQDARDEMLNLVTELRDASLLLGNGGNMHFDMHDLVWKFAKSTALELHVLDDSRNLSDARERIKWIYLSNGDRTEFPSKVPQLTFFHLSKEDPSLVIPSNYFDQSNELRVLGLTKMDFPSISLTFSNLKKLQTLRLDQSVLGVANLGLIIKELENLQVLSLARCDIEELPNEINNLSKLKLLDLSDCTKLKVIPSGVLSSLSRLEELYLRNSFDQWVVEEVKEPDNKNASVADLGELNLTVIEVRICNIQMIPEDLFSRNLASYKILIGEMWNYWDSSCGSLKVLKLKLDARISALHSVFKLLKKTRELHLAVLNGVKNVVNELDNEGFQELKYLSIQDAVEIQHIVNSVEHVFPALEVLLLHSLDNMEKICHGPLGVASFRKLRVITVECCNKLKNLFSFSMVKQLHHLQQIIVKDCSILESIVDDESQGGGQNDGASDQGRKPKFPEMLGSLRLQYLPELNCFNSSCKISMTFFNKQVAYFKVNKLKKLIIESCDNLEHMFSSSMARCLESLEHLEIRECKTIKEVIFTDTEEEEVNLIFHKLNFLHIENLEKLVRFYSGICFVEFPSLKELQVLNCPILEGFTNDNNSPRTHTLFNEHVIFPNLEFLKLSSINIQQIWHSPISHTSSFGQNLKKLFVEGCGHLKYLSVSSIINCFEQLIVLKIFNCKMIEGIIFEERMSESKISFPELDTLELEDLPKLTRFTISMCHGVSSENAENTYTSSFFDEKVEFPHLKFLRLSSINIHQIWRIPISVLSSIQNLEMLIVEGCDNLKYLFTSSMIQSFKQLMVLKIHHCKIMEEVIVEEERMSNSLFLKLDTLELEDLPKLTRFCHENDSNRTQFKISECPAASENGTNAYAQSLFDEKVEFPNLKVLRLSSINNQQIWANLTAKSSSVQNLEKLFVEDCGNLKYLLTSSMVKSFERLIALQICDCKMMEEVIVSKGLGEAEGMYESFFSNLDILELEDLPKLIRLCYGNYIKFSNLRQFMISKCPVLKTLISGSIIGDMAASSKENAEKTYTHHLFDEKVSLPRLERLIIKFMESLTKIWDDRHDINSCCQLNSLSVASCEKLLNVFPFSMLESVRQKLDKLEIWNCDSLEEIFGAGKPQAEKITNLVEVAPNFAFKELTHLNLFKLPELKGFFPEMHIIEWPSLKSLWMYECNKMSIFASELPSYRTIEGNDQLEIQIQCPETLHWISKGIFLNKRNGNTSYILPARHLAIWHGEDTRYWDWIFIPDSRLEVAQLRGVNWFEIRGRINTRMLSPTRCNVYLVFKLGDNFYGFRNRPIEATVQLGGSEVLKRTVSVQATGEIVRGDMQYPKERGDDWLELELGEFSNEGGKHRELQIRIFHFDSSQMGGVIILGIEFRPN